MLQQPQVDKVKRICAICKCPLVCKGALCESCQIETRQAPPFQYNVYWAKQHKRWLEDLSPWQENAIKGLEDD